MKNINNKALKFYLAFVVLTVAGFGYSSWRGITFWGDKVERNTEYNSNSRSHSGYGGRFYHK